MPIAFTVPSYKRPEAMIEINNRVKNHPYDVKVCVTSGVSYPDFEGWQQFCTNERVQVGKARNMILAKAFSILGENAMYVISDDDMYVPFDVTMDLYQFMIEHPECGMVCPVGIHSSADRDFREKPYLYYEEFGVSHCVIMISGRLLHTIGFHDPDLTFREDADFYIRTKCAGFETYKLNTNKCQMLGKYEKSGGFEAPANTEKRKALLSASAEFLCTRYPFCKTASNGNMLLKNNYAKLTEEEKKKYVFNYPPAPEVSEDWTLRKKR